MVGTYLRALSRPFIPGARQSGMTLVTNSSKSLNRARDFLCSDPYGNTVVGSCFFKIFTFCARKL